MPRDDHGLAFQRLVNQVRQEALSFGDIVGTHGRLLARSWSFCPRQRYVTLCPDGPRENSLLKFGISLFFTEYSMTPAAPAQEIEQRGFESVWSGEHSRIPLAQSDTVRPALDEIGALMAAVNA
jgi:hypothetical protein